MDEPCSYTTLLCSNWQAFWCEIKNCKRHKEMIERYLTFGKENSSSVKRVNNLEGEKEQA